MKGRLYKRLSCDFGKILEDGDRYDVVIEVGELPINQSYNVHSIILRHRCPSLYKELNEISLDTSDVKTIYKPHISTKAFTIIIKYIYCGKVCLKGEETSTVADILNAAYEFSLEELVLYIQNFLVKSRAPWLRLNFSKFNYLNFQDDIFKKFREFYNINIVKYPKMGFDSEEHTSLSKNDLISLLKGDDLQIEEVKIWRHIIQWGKAQNRDLPVSIDEWNDKHFETLKNSVKELLPHIRYFQIPGENIIKDLKPYEKILPPSLLDDLAQKIIAPQLSVSSTILPTRDLTILELSVREDAITSNVITQEHAAQISSWIDRATYSVESNPYKFNLLIRGSKDGFEYSTFWEKCNKMKSLVVVLEVEKTGEILGGYNPIGWNEKIQSYSSDTNSFIFSLKTENTSQSIVSRVKNFQRAIKNFHHEQGGPAFGSLDFQLEGNFKTGKSGYCLRYDYETPIRSERSFSVKDYEVFQVRLCNKK